MAAPPVDAPRPPEEGPHEVVSRRPGTPAEFVDRFPDSINGARVRKVKTPDAKFTLVHIRQVHDDGSITPQRNIREAYTERIAGVPALARTQTEIHALLTRLIRDHGMQEIYLEGLVAGDEKRAEEDARGLAAGQRSLRQTRRRRKELEQQLRDVEALIATTDGALHPYLGDTGMTAAVRQQVSKLNQAIEKEVKEIEASASDHDSGVRVALAAALPFVQSRRLRLQGAETAEANRKAGEALKRIQAAEKPDEADAHLVMGAREAIVLAHVAAGTRPVGYTMYGAAHDFEPSIEAWNKANPTKKFSLIEITPPSLIPPPLPPPGGGEGVPLPPP